MTATDIGGARLSDVEHRAQLRRALIASTVGTTIEWYDFLLYGQVTGLIFGKLFFPQSDPLVGVLQAFAVFFVGFLGRPIGAAIFGHWGDRIGRKAVESGCDAVALGRTYLLPPLSSGGASLVRPWLRFHTPLIEPDRRIYRIRLSDKTSRLHPRRAAPKLG